MNKLKIAIVSLIACLTFAGCAGDAIAMEPNPTEETKAAIAESATSSYKVGDRVGCVRHANNTDEATASEYTLIAKTDDYVIVSPAYCGLDASFDELVDELMNRTTDGEWSMLIYPIEDCYPDLDTAEAVADKENKE